MCELGHRHGVARLEQIEHTVHAVGRRRAAGRSLGSVATQLVLLRRSSEDANLRNSFGRSQWIYEIFRFEKDMLVARRRSVDSLRSARPTGVQPPARK